MSDQLKNSSEEIAVIRKHSLAIRWTHWLNFPLITLMIVSGIMIYWAHDPYTPFIPRGFYKKIGIDHQLALGMGIHFFFMWFFVLNGLIYTAYLWWSGEWREILPRFSSIIDAVKVTLHDLGLRKEKPPQGKFNGGQKIAYTSVSILALLQVLTGLAIYKPVQLQPLLTLFGGYETTRLIHFIVTVLLVLFFGIHLLQVVRAGWNNFRSMVTGTEEITQDDSSQARSLESE